MARVRLAVWTPKTSKRGVWLYPYFFAVNGPPTRNGVDCPRVDLLFSPSAAWLSIWTKASVSNPEPCALTDEHASFVMKATESSGPGCCHHTRSNTLHDITTNYTVFTVAYFYKYYTNNQC